MIVIIRPFYYDYYCYQSQCQADEKSKEIKKNQEQQSRISAGQNQKGSGRARHKQHHPTFKFVSKIYVLFVYLFMQCYSPAQGDIHMRQWFSSSFQAVSHANLYTFAGGHNTYSRKIYLVSAPFVYFALRLLLVLLFVLQLLRSPLLSPCHVSASLPHVPELFI